MLVLVRNSINRVPEAAALFYDELANVIEKRQLDTKTEVTRLFNVTYDRRRTDDDDDDGIAVIA